MASSLKPGGFISVNSQFGHSTGMLKTFPIANGYATNIFKGDLVKLGTDGTIQKVTVSTDYPIGVFAGLYPERQGRNPSAYWVASTSVTSGGTTTMINCMVVTDPGAVFEVQADGSVSVGDVGTNFDVTVGTGNTAYGISTSRVHASSRSDAAGVVKMLGFSTRADNTPLDAYPYVLVKVNNTQNFAKTSVG